MNDSTEIKYAFEQARSLAYQHTSHWDAAKRQRLRSELILQHERVDSMHIFASSFSEGEDLLSQWRGYAGLNGYCLGFSLSALKDVAKDQGFLVGEVAYDRIAQNSILDPIIRLMIAECENEDLVKDDPGSLDRILWKHTMAVARAAPLIKHPSFSEEREWRVYSDTNVDQTEKYDFFVRNNEIVPYIKLNLARGTHPESRSYFPLTDICARSFGVGPGANQKERRDALLAAAGRHRVHWKIGTLSKSPLR